VSWIGTDYSARQPRTAVYPIRATVGVELHACRRNKCTECAGRDIKRFRNFLVGQVVEIAEAEDLGLPPGQLGDGLAQAVGQFAFHRQQVRSGIGRVQGQAIERDDRPAFLPEPIQSPARGHLAQVARPAPDAAVGAQPKHLQEYFLDDILGVGGMAQNSPRRAEHHRPVLADDAFPIGHRFHLRRNGEWRLPANKTRQRPAMLPESCNWLTQEGADVGEQPGSRS
jgi:hypothetical protein